jgi:ethanolamine utilization protein EutA (predicted chaperonin)
MTKLSKAKVKEFETLAKPLIKFLAENTNPHTSVIVTSNDAELVVGQQMYVNNTYLKGNETNEQCGMDSVTRGLKL